MTRLAALLTVLLLAVPVPAALAQTGDGGGGGGAFGPLPPAAPAATPTPTPDPAVEAQKGTDRTLLYAIGGGLLVLFVVIGRVITRDARRTLHEEGRSTGPKLREEGPHRHARQSKAKARAKTKAQRRARRQNR
jgi:pyruvate/2-oxoglutarate dehydrogenase complex dihydrolipoamide acyltransferase (E2) component